jgi:tetratricopeptide (TPR) repeat protein
MEAAARHYFARDYVKAERYCRAVLAREPRHFDAQHLLGVIHLDRGQAAEAIAHLEKAVALEPLHARLRYHLGSAFLEGKRYEAAESELRRAFEMDPGDAGTLNNLGTALTGLGRHGEAIDCFRRLLAADPQHVQALYNLGNALAALDRLEEALACYRTALPLVIGGGAGKKLAELHGNMNEALVALGRHDEALAGCRSLAATDPHGAAWNESVIRLLFGELDAGWKLYESRWHIADHDPLPEGASLPSLAEMTGKRVLLLAEQGHGDMIQFMRYAPLLARRGVRVVLQIYRELAALAREIEGLEAVVIPGEPAPAVDIKTPLLSLPHLFGTTLETMPAEVPYLRPPAERLARWEQRLGPRVRPRIGIAWWGMQHIRKRSLPIEMLLPLLIRPGVEFHSLQKEIPGGQQDWLADHPVVIDHSAALEDFADTAALISGLDLVISIDTSVAHLSGALAKPTWVMLQHSADWRWLRGRSDSPWYPTMRLFRQRQRGDWAGLVADLAAALDDRMAGGPAGTR